VLDRAVGRSSTAGDRPVPADDGIDNVLRTFVSLFRRRARAVALGLAFGLAFGVTWTLVVPAPGSGTKYYKATTTLVALDDSTATVDPGLPVVSSLGSPLPTALRYAQSVQLTDAVAKQFGVAADTVARHVSAVRNVDVAYPALGITALATSPRIAEAMATHAAQLTIDHTGRDDVATASRATLEASLRGLQSQRERLDVRIATVPADVDDLRRQLLGVQSRISALQEQLVALTSVPDAPTLEVQQPARAIQINAQGFTYRVDQNENAQSSLETQKQRQEGPDFDETDLSQSWPPAKPLRIPLALALGLIAGAALAVLVEAWDDRIRNRDDAERITGLPVLAEIPDLGATQSRRGVAILDDAMMPLAERFRSIRTALELALHDERQADGRAPVVLVTSPSPGEGKTTVAANLAAAFAASGTRTLAIDGDFRRPRLHHRLDPTPDPVSPGDPQFTSVPDLSYLAGPVHTHQPDLAIDTIEELIHTWRASHDLIVLDTPPILTTNDAADLLGVADLVVVVVRAGQTRRRVARRVASQLQRLRADVAGVVLNDCDVDRTDGYSYYYDRRAEPHAAPVAGRSRSGAEAVPVDEPSERAPRR
jgi:Mrp family chromosome partitioning ATPase